MKVRDIKPDRGLNSFLGSLKCRVPYMIRRLVFRETKSDIKLSQIEVAKLCIFAETYIKYEPSKFGNSGDMEYRFKPDFNPDWKKEYCTGYNKITVENFNKSLEFLTSEGILDKGELEIYKLS